LTGPFFSLASETMKANIGCSLPIAIAYRAFRLNVVLMVASTDLVSQPSDIFSVQPPSLHSVKLESPDNLVHLSSDSFEDELPNVSFPTPVVEIPIHNDKTMSHLSLFVPLLLPLVNQAFLAPCST
jgi:hypothetical protein